jgi:hypothetical protein
MRNSQNKFPTATVINTVDFCHLLFAIRDCCSAPQRLRGENVTERRCFA